MNLGARPDRARKRISLCIQWNLGAIYWECEGEKVILKLINSLRCDYIKIIITSLYSHHKHAYHNADQLVNHNPVNEINLLISWLFGKWENEGKWKKLRDKTWKLKLQLWIFYLFQVKIGTLTEMGISIISSNKQRV